MASIRSAHGVIGLVLATSVGAVACAGSAVHREEEPGGKAPAMSLEDAAVVRAKDAKVPPFAFDAEDEAFLGEVQRGAFLYFWHEAEPKTGLIADRTGRRATASVAGVGFNLAVLPVGVERGWVGKDEAAARAGLILKSLMSDPRIRHRGLFQHFIEAKSGGPHTDPGLEQVISTVDSALLFCGIIVAAEYFGGEVARAGNEILEAAEWNEFAASAERTPGVAPAAMGFISLGYKVENVMDPVEKHRGMLLPYLWLDSGCEHRLVTFLAASTADPARGVPAETYYKLRRQPGWAERFGADGAVVERTNVVWFPYSGALFVNTFSHLFLNYAAAGVDAPEKFGVTMRPAVDWWENSRRITNLHRWRALENPRGKPTLGEHAWGLTASDYPGGYQVPGVFPRSPSAFFEIRGGKRAAAKPEVDFSTFVPKDDYGDGTIAPYGPGGAILFEPEAALAALRYAYELKDEKGERLVWREPSAPSAGSPGGYGFVDSYNLKGPGGKAWAAPEYVAIDQGPLLLAIENARTGLIWELFHRHALVKRGCERLGISVGR